MSLSQSGTRRFARKPRFWGWWLDEVYREVGEVVGEGSLFTFVRLDSAAHCHGRLGNSKLVGR